MNYNIFFIISLVIILLGVIDIANAIKCYHCSGADTDHPFQCNEWLSDDIDMEPIDCGNVYGAKYCVKHIGRYEKGIGAKRFCSSLDLGNYCNIVKQPGDLLDYRTCIYTCTGDGCNGSNVKTYSKLLFIFAIFIVSKF